ncbi:MAG: transcription antitermination protein NusG [Thermoplasmatales archaeon E-plasma]|jgi:transcriptional antiterminator NusG|nr:MAG: transcription antitermination protein NusG [Thermoplasmatales archaeon E-plasma]MCL4348364.1 transcription elongation factor Spt5 [Candidatus Thermoplasmatota archaeon]MCL5787682.1 transcription elongation factor Spt5 [Candidatus Thermoplasmatota archaeon]
MESSANEFKWIDIEEINKETGCGIREVIPVTIKNIQKGKRKFNIKVTPEIKEKDPLIEWEIGIIEGKDLAEPILPNETKTVSKEIELDSNQSRRVNLEIGTPKGGYFGDSISIQLSIASEDGINSGRWNFQFKLKPTIIVVKTNVGNELQVARDMDNRDARDMEERLATNPDATREIMAIMSPYEVKGYLFVETMHPDRISYISRGIRGFKGLAEGSIDIEEIAHYLIPKPAVTGLELGSFVELIDGPFKGEKAKIMSIDSGKEEVTVQLIESMVPIPVTVRAEAIRVLESGKK